MRRRTFLATGLAASVALSGCSGNSSDGGDSGADSTPDEAGTGPESTATPADGEPMAGHPATTGMDTQPTLGPDPSEATAVIVAYEDPSCPRCASFEMDIVPQLQSNHIDAGELSLVFRGYPVVYEWGQRATRALEAAYDRSPGAHWALAEHYFGSQDDFRYNDISEVYPKTQEFLAEETDLDAETVVGEAESGAYDDAVQTDLDAGMEAGAKEITPHLFMFRDGVYRTKASGYVSYDLLRSTLEL